MTERTALRNARELTGAIRNNVDALHLHHGGHRARHKVGGADYALCTKFKNRSTEHNKKIDQLHYVI